MVVFRLIVFWLIIVVVILLVNSVVCWEFLVLMDIWSVWFCSVIRLSSLKEMIRMLISILIIEKLWCWCVLVGVGMVFMVGICLECCWIGFFWGCIYGLSCLG